MMFTQVVRVEALLNIRDIVKGYHLCHFEVKVGEVFTANKKLKLWTVVDNSATYSPSLWTLFGHYMQIF